MSSIVTLNGIPYVIPATGDTGWGQEVTNYLIALGSGGVLQLQGGSFPLLSDLNVGPNYGIVSPYFKSNASNISTTGSLRLANTDTIAWRNGANTGNLALSVSGDALYFNGSVVNTGTITLTGDVTGSGTSSISTTLGTVPIAKGGTGFTTANNALNALLPTQTSNANKYLKTDGTNTSWATISGGSGTVTSVGISSTSLSVSGSPVTTSGTITVDLSNSGVTAGVYHLPVVTVDNKGIITAISDTTIELIGGVSESITTGSGIDARYENISKFTMSTNLTLGTPSNLPSIVDSSFTVTYVVTQGASAYTLTWFSGIKWQGGVAPTLTVTNGVTDIFVLTTFDAGTSWYGSYSQGYV